MIPWPAELPSLGARLHVELYDAVLAVVWAGLAIGCGVVAATIGIGALCAFLFTKETEMVMPKIEVWKRDAGDWRWHLKAANGEIQAQGEGYLTKAGALRGVRAFVRNARIAEVVVKP